jgi:hypothetical protein
MANPHTPDPDRGIAVNSGTDPQRPGTPVRGPRGGDPTSETGVPAEMPPSSTPRSEDSDVESPGPGVDDPL